MAQDFFAGRGKRGDVGAMTLAGAVRSRRNSCSLTLVRIAMTAAMVGVVGVVGCTQSVAPPEVLEKTYVGPAIAVEQSVGNHVVVATMPSPGWIVRLDRVLEGYRFQGAYVTLQEPNPAFSYAQVMVSQRVATNIRQTEAIKVFVRFQDFNGEAMGDEGYTLAGGSDVAAGQIAQPANLK